MSKKILVSLTTIPRRAEGTSLVETIGHLLQQDIECEILINIPHEYRKWGAFELPGFLQALPGITIHRPHTDYCPATKLLGALEYVRMRSGIEHIVTVDDDICFRDSSHLRYLLSYARTLPGHAVTVGGVRLKSPPYTRNNGLKYRSLFRYVDVPAGYKGVVYPVDALIASRLPFDLKDGLMEGLFHDDDAYFGIVLSQLGVPLLAVPGRLGAARRGHARGSGESGVQEKAPMDRRENEGEIFRYARERRLLGSLSQRVILPMPVLRRALGVYLKWCTGRMK